MARKRMIDPEFWLDEGLSQLDPFSRLLYIGLWGICDDNYATLPYKPAWIKVQIFPYDQIDIDKHISELITAGKLVKFTDNQSNFLYIKNFFKYQKIDRPSEPKYPAFIGQSPSLDEDSTRTRSEVKLSEVKLKEDKLMPLELFEKFKTNPLWDELIKKYPDRDYSYHFQLMCDWYLTKKKRLPKNISSFDNWLSKTKPDPALTERRLAAIKKAEDEKRVEELKKIPTVKAETLAKLKDQINQAKQGIKTI